MLQNLYLIVLGFTGALFGTNVGGSGLLVVPGLTLLGITAKDSVVTFEIGALGMMLVGAKQFHHHKRIDYSVAVPLTVLSALGAMLGASLLTTTTETVFNKAAAVLLLVLLLPLIFLPSLGIEKFAAQSVKAPGTISHVLFFLCGLWSGFVSAGSSLVTNYVLIYINKKTFLDCAGITKIQGLGTGCAAVAIYLWAGLVDWPRSFALFAGMGAGAYVGAYYALKKGEVFVRGLFVAIIVVSAYKLLY